MLRIIFNLLFFLLFIGTVAAVAMVGYILPTLPNMDNLTTIKMQVPLRVYTEDGALIAEYGDKRRTPIRIDQIDPLVLQAFIAAEDDRFFSHHGIDWHGIIRAAYWTLLTNSKRQGGSTITMQVARNFFLSNRKTYERKIKEILLALKIERELNKNEIFELYLNKIFFGQRAYGVRAAAQVYYGKELEGLNLAQIAMLAGLPQAPSEINPIRNPEKAIKRRGYVLRRMLEKQFITQEQYQQTLTEPLSASLYAPRNDVEAAYVAEMVRQHLVTTMGLGNRAYTDGIRVTTTLISSHQIAANHALRQALLEYDHRHGYRGAEQHVALKKGQKNESLYIAILDNFTVFADLLPALITEVHTQSASAFIKGLGPIEIGWSGLEWARPYITEDHRGAKPKTAGDIVKVGDIVRLYESIEGEWKLAQLPAIEGALVSMNPNDGAVLALIGGFSFFKNQFNRATQAKRQPGSAFKPFIYSAALATGKTAASIINDSPITFNNGMSHHIWRPQNYSLKNYGPTRLREAVIHSRNLPSIRLLHEMGTTKALRHINRFGFDTTNFPKNLSLALGSGEVSPWALARGYCVFANGGHLIDPHFIKTIVDQSDTILFQTNPKIVCPTCPPAADTPINGTGATNHAKLPDTKLPDTKLPDTKLPEGEDTSTPPTTTAPLVIDPRNIYIMNSITRDVIKQGTARKALSLGRGDLSGKTGTTNNQHDAWFAGFNTEVVAITWIGFDKFQPLGKGETGGRTALPAWIKYMKTVLGNTVESTMKRPEGLIEVRIDPDSGEASHASARDTMFEIFRTEYAPQIRYHSEYENSPTQDKAQDIMEIF